MNSGDRLRAALRRQPVDRVPVNVTYYMAGFYRQHLAPRLAGDLYDERLDSYTRFGFDPLVGVGGTEGRVWLLQDAGRWEVRQEASIYNGERAITYIVETPKGQLATIYGDTPDQSGWQLEPLLKNEEDLDLLAYAPLPVADVAAIDERVERLGEQGLGYVGVNGIWQEACYLRGMENLAMDALLNPEWTVRYLGILGDRLAAQAKALCRSRAEAFFINESYLGMGISLPVFERLIRPHDERVIRIAKDAGKLALYHDCGRCNALLERFVEMGIDYLETITPYAAGGDIEIADVKRRIGAQVCLRGAVNHQLMATGAPADVEQEVLRCLRTLAPGGGYIVCPSGPILDDTPYENLLAFAEAAARYGAQYAG